MHHVITCIALIGASSGSAEPIEIKERLSPKNMVQIVKGQCGEHQYSMELTNTNQTKVLSVSVDGKPVSAEEIKRVTGAVAPGYFLFDPKFPECFWDRPNARMRIATDGPASNGIPAWLSFEISPAGIVSSVKPD